MYISESAIKRMLREAGARRVSSEARMEFQRHINRTAFAIAKKAVVLSKHAKRKTVEASDIKLAAY
ncbi:MAG: NFYB/HAP3 family transcription factor subunit [Candidatus Micrarchaeota archaeon]|nr:NFYB/HAP3 family transcription factor subunit [Candidatus Micrarchaeota archaeon]